MKTRCFIWSLHRTRLNRYPLCAVIEHGSVRSLGIHKKRASPALNKRIDTREQKSHPFLLARAGRGSAMNINVNTSALCCGPLREQ